MSATRLIVVLSSLVLLSTLVHGSNQTVTSEELEVIDGAARVEIFELVLQDYNKLTADYQKLSSDCEKNVSTAINICEKCGKSRGWSELTEREISDLTDIAVLSVKNEMSKRSVVAVTCETCELDENALLNHVCRGITTEQKHLNSLSELSISLESTMVITSVFYDKDSIDFDPNANIIYTRVYVTTSFNNYTSEFKSNTFYTEEVEAALKKMGMVIGKEAYRRFKLVSGMTTG